MNVIQNLDSQIRNNSTKWAVGLKRVKTRERKLKKEESKLFSIDKYKQDVNVINLDITIKSHGKTNKCCNKL